VIDVVQLVVVEQAAVDATQGVMKIAAFDSTGAPVTLVVSAATVSAALAEKAEIAALTSGSNAAAIVAALQA
jgi:hypothetical protein